MPSGSLVEASSACADAPGIDGDVIRERFGVEPIGKVLQLAPSTFRRAAARRRDPGLRSVRARRNERLVSPTGRVWQLNRQV